MSNQGLMPFTFLAPNQDATTARPCDSEGNFLPPGTPPPLLSDKTSNDWTPYADRLEFELANYIFTKNQTPVVQINHLLDIWADSLIQGGANTDALFTDHCDVYKPIDSTHLGDVQWQLCLLKYTGEHAVDDAAPWMEDSYDVWFCNPHDVVQNMLANPDYTLEMDLQPYCEFMTKTDERQWQDFMSGDWAWNQADQISDDLDTHGLTFVPVILGSNKTTVSVATGQNDYYPLYMSIRNVHNNVCCAHCKVVAVIGFLAMLKRTKQHTKTTNFHNFLARFGDGHYRHVIYGLGPYIADYEEQVSLMVQGKCLLYHKSLDGDSLRRSKTHTEALIEECDHLALWDEFGIVAQLVSFTNDFPRANIHELIAPDLLHQIIKGIFKDHLVVWVEKYLVQTHGKTQADVILDDIDRRFLGSRDA
ncbi:uncharacterized protein EDB91DRAFT_1240245 [Suillus paluster]|uniref:uncharacterized protein n=1 Tax=Suillus paluster TaxID=48578 RepID=UPI001B87A5B1|nr:uncharacterized protein EDB91DRAFT_1240245 [Suillus paluster]KAG1722135.1 hypothetical protein EDB91DRAFT_1240245 [Suillus paluster]